MPWGSIMDGHSSVNGGGSTGRLVISKRAKIHQCFFSDHAKFKGVLLEKIRRNNYQRIDYPKGFRNTTFLQISLPSWGGVW